MVRGGAEGEVTALLAHVDGVVQPSVARVAVRGVVGILVRGAHPSPLHVLRRCLVGVPCAAVDEVAGASAALVLAGAVDADAMVGELIAALAASAAAVAERAPRPSRADAFGTGVSADAASAEAHAHVAAALVRGVGLVVAASIGGPAELDLWERDWAGPAHPLARALRAFPGAAAAPAMDAVAAALGDGPDSAAALSRAPRRVAFARLRPFLKHALLSDSAALRDTGFAQALHARLVRLACAGGALAAPAAELVADCLPWYRGVPRGSAGARHDAARAAARDAWLSTACTDVADAVESAFSGCFLESELSSDAVTLASAAARAAEACVARLAERETRKGAFPEAGPGWSAATLGSARRLLAVATATRDDGSAFLCDDSDDGDDETRARFASLACDVGALVPGAAARHAGEAAALVSLLARFFAGPLGTKAKETNVSGGSGETEGGSVSAIPDEEEEALVGRHTAAAAVVAARVASALGLPPARGGRLAATLATPPRRSVSFRVGGDASLPETERFRKRERNRRAAVTEKTFRETETFRATCASPDAALAHALEPLWCEDQKGPEARGHPRVSARLLRALEADGAADDARVAAERRRRRAKTGRGSEDSSSITNLAPPSVAPPTLPLVLLAHPSSAVREGAARAFAERVAAVPERAPAALPPLLARLRADSLAFGLKADAADDLDARSARAEAKALLAGLRAVAAGAAHPLGAPVALRALAPLVEPLEKENGGVADPRARALALRLLAELWKHHRGSFPRLKGALEHAVTSSPEVPEVLIGAAAACAFCADEDPYAATELAGPLRACLSPSAPPAAAALALEAVASLCEADALDFYAALKVVVTRPHLAARPEHLSLIHI